MEETHSRRSWSTLFGLLRRTVAPQTGAWTLRVSEVAERLLVQHIPWGTGLSFFVMIRDTPDVWALDDDAYCREILEPAIAECLWMAQEAPESAGAVPLVVVEPET